MNGTASIITELIADCDIHGVRLLLADGGGLTIDGTQDVLTPERLARLKAHKAELVAILRGASAFDVVHVVAAEPALAAHDGPSVCRCGSTKWRDVPIHDGRSTRRDCGRCGRFIRFPIWHGKDALHNEQ